MIAKCWTFLKIQSLCAFQRPSAHVDLQDSQMLVLNRFHSDTGGVEEWRKYAPWPVCTPNPSSLTGGDCTPDHASSCNCKSGMFKSKEQQEKKAMHPSSRSKRFMGQCKRPQGPLSGLYEFYPQKFPTQPSWLFFSKLENICKLHLWGYPDGFYKYNLYVSSSGCCPRYL